MDNPLEDTKEIPTDVDQTTFSQSQESFQAPPEEVARKLQLEEDKNKPPEPKKKNLKLIIVGILGVFVLFSVLLLVLLRSGMLGEAGTTLSPTPPPVTLPTNPPKSQTEMGQKLESIQQQLEDNNPAEVDLDPPPLNYSISL